ncbi:fibronectin type III domain-containing protein, partial [Flavobacterium sp. MAH-1]
MKKITFFLVLFLIGFAGKAQLHETFDGGSVAAPTGLGAWNLPSGTWQVLDNGVGNLNWTISSTSVYPANTDPNAAYINRQNIGSGNTSRDYLVSPAFPVPANPQLRFQTRTTLAGFQNTVFEVRAALGTSDPTDQASYTYVLGTWNDDLINTGAFDQYEEKVIDLPDFGGAATIYIEFVKITTQSTGAQTGERWLVDDIHVVEKCQDADVETLVSNASTADSITLDWDSTGNNQWEVHILPVGVALTDAGTPIIVNGAPTLTVTATTEQTPQALTPLTCYVFYVRSICFAPGEWVGPSGSVCTQALPPDCGGNYVDSGGGDGNYSNNESSTITICPENVGDIVTVTFTAFSTESGWDGMYVYDGNGTDDPLIPSENGAGFNGDLSVPGAYWGNVVPGPFEASNADGCLTFQFFSDGVINQAGWAANVTCGPAPTCPKPTAVTAISATDESITVTWTPVGTATLFEVLAVPAGSAAPGPGDSGIETSEFPFTYPGLASITCFDIYVRAKCSDTDISNWSLKETYCTQITPPDCGGVFVDQGGPDGNYPGNSDSVVTICPDNVGDIVTVTFTSFNTEANWDGMYIYDGDSVNDPLIPSNNGPGFNGDLDTPGAYWGNTNPGSFESSSPDGCLTFQFFSDGFFNTTGWTANVTCGPAPTCPKPTAVTLGEPTAFTIPVSWTPVGPATLWHVYAVPCGSAPPTSADPGFQEATSSTGFELTDLDSATCYDIYVFSICSDTDASNGAGPRTATTLVAPPECDGIFIDDGGPANYPNQSDSVVTICPDNEGDQVTVTFTMFDTETNWDGIYVFDGDSVDDPMIASDNPPGFGPLTQPGAYWGNTIPGPFTSSSADGCLTFWFLSDFSVNDPGWTANVTCLPPPTCPKPTAVTIVDTTPTTVTVSWTEVGSATQWHVLVLPATDPVPDANTPGWEVANATTYTYGTITPLTPATQYKVYVRAFCSEDDISLWSNPKSFSTTPENDECLAAIEAPVNPTADCMQSVPGTLIGATASTQENTCTGTADDDAWFQFTAQTSTHAITLSNIQGNAFNLQMSLFSGNCDGGLTLVDCSPAFSNQMIVSPLEPGTVYYIRVWSETETPNQNSTFDLCITTVPPPIYTSTTDYTVEELVTDILINSDCASVSNITYSTGTNFGSVNGIGYFNKNGSTFPYEEGIVLSSGNVDNAPGPNTTNLSEGDFNWTGDADLEAIILAATGQPMNSRNASIIEFDFIPIIPNLSFNFLFASEEYGTFQCSFSDAFAFLLTDMTDMTAPQNLAVLPNSSTPVSVVTIRDQAYNPGCASVNPEYFDEYYLLPEGSDPIGAPINYNGVTVGLTAAATVIPGHTYHIKLAIADRSDTAYDSAVFLEGGSFNIGDIELGQNFLEADGTALCDGSSFTLDTELDPTLYTFQWTLGGQVIPGATGPTLVVTEGGIYGATATYNNSTCNATDEVTIEFYPPVQPGTPENLVECNSSGFAEFTLSDADAAIVGSLNPAVYSVTYYASEADANGQVNALPNLYTNVVQFDQTIWANLHTPSGCFAVVSLHLIVQDLAPQFTMTENFSMCEGATGTISVIPGNFDPNAVTYSWTVGGQPLPDTTQTISVTEAGVYQVTVNNAGCTGTGSTEVTLTPGPVAPDDVTVCDSYVLPTLPSAGNYFTLSGGNGTPLFAGDTVTETQTIYVYSANCPNEDSFLVTINHLTAFVPEITNGCSQYVLPDPGANNTYYTAAGGPGGGGAVMNPGDIITQDNTTVYVYANDGICTAEASFVVTIGDITAITMPDVTVCDSYTLPALPANHTYNTAADCSGTILNAGATITSTQTVYICAVLGTCSDTSEFLVTVNVTPNVGNFQNVVACDSYALPTLTTGAYYSQTGGVSPITGGDLTLGVGTHTIYVYASVGTAPNTCTDEASFTVTVTASPVADVLTDVTQCEGQPYTLPALSAGNAYFGGPGGTGASYAAGQQISQTTQLYIYAVSPDNSQCTDESSFTVTITDSPEFTLAGGCQGNA